MPSQGRKNKGQSKDSDRRPLRLGTDGWRVYRGLGCRLTRNQLWLNRNLLTVAFSPLNLLEQGLKGNLAHLPQRLANRREARIVELGQRNVIEPHHRDIAWNLVSSLLKSSHRAECRNVVVGKQG